jgi:hypothetical protein
LLNFSLSTDKSFEASVEALESVPNNIPVIGILGRAKHGLRCSMVFSVIENSSERGI